MSVEFVDTNVLVYAHDRNAVTKREPAAALLARLFRERTGALSTQVCIEFYVAATRKLQVSSEHAEAVIKDLGPWLLHRPTHADVVNSIRLQRRHQLSWWDAMIVNSAIEMEARILWSEDLSDGQRFGRVTVRNPFL